MGTSHRQSALQPVVPNPYLLSLDSRSLFDPVKSDCAPVAKVDSTARQPLSAPNESSERESEPCAAQIGHPVMIRPLGAHVDAHVAALVDDATCAPVATKGGAARS